MESEEHPPQLEPMERWFGFTGLLLEVPYLACHLPKSQEIYLMSLPWNHPGEGESQPISHLKWKTRSALWMVALMTYTSPSIIQTCCCCCCCLVTSVMSDSVWSHRRQPTRLPRPWDSPGKNTGVGCHCLLQCVEVKSESEVAQSCLTLSDPMDCSLPGFSIHGIFQARVLEWGATRIRHCVSRSKEYEDRIWAT